MHANDICVVSCSERFDKMIVGLEKEQTDSRDRLARLQAEYQQLINKTGSIR